MAQIRRTLQAQQDLEEIWDYIAADSIEAAEHVIRKIEDTAKSLASSPLMGQACPQWEPGLRYFSISRSIRILMW